MISSKQGCDLIPVPVLELVFDEAQLRNMALSEFRHLEHAADAVEEEFKRRDPRRSTNWTEFYAAMLIVHFKRWGWRGPAFHESILTRVPLVVAAMFKEGVRI